MAKKSLSRRSGKRNSKSKSMGALSKDLTHLCQEVSKERLWEHAKNISQWQRISGTPGEEAAVSYFQEQLDAYGLETHLYRFEALLGWPEEAQLEVRSPRNIPIKAITHSLSPSTDPEGLVAEVVYLGDGEESDFSGRSVAGKVVMLEGMASPMKILRGQKHGVQGEIFIMDRLRDMCVSPVWGTPTPRTSELLPKIPVVSILREQAQEIKFLLKEGPIQAWMRTKTFQGWRPVSLLTGDLQGVTEPDSFILFSGHHCSWYFGAMDNGTANATMLEVARILAGHRKQLQRGLRFAFWPGHTQGRYAGSTWYFDQFWEDLHDHCILHINIDSLGARGATIYHSLAMPETRDFGLAAIKDAIGVEGHYARQARAGDQSFWGCGIPALWMELSQVPPELAAELGGSGLFTAGGQGASQPQGSMPWWWHTADDTLDKIDPEVHVRDTRVYVLACARAAMSAILPFRYGPAAQFLRETLHRYSIGAGDRLALEPVVDRAKQLEAEVFKLDALLDQIRQGTGKGKKAADINRRLMNMDRRLIRMNFSAVDPFDQDLAVPIPPVPMMEPAERLSRMDPRAAETRYLITELTRNRNRVMFQLREALEFAKEAAAAIRGALQT
jgi:Iap family predicted aminopeptidase